MRIGVEMSRPVRLPLAAFQPVVSLDVLKDALAIEALENGAIDEHWKFGVGHIRSRRNEVQLRLDHGR